MRLADGAHIDSRRAPTFLQSLRRPEGESLAHWDFQNHILRPLAKGDHIVYTSSASFAEPEIDAWWLCFDTLAYFDRQLSLVDALLTDSGRKRFQIRSVAGIEDPRRLAKLIQTKGWLPVDTQIRVGNVASLVLRLGGEQLYGNDLTVPLRELIQNAADAILARRAIDPYFNGGLIRVSLLQEGETWTLRVADDGVGMSESVLTGALIDFGASFWKSPEARGEFPGLTQSHFSSTGRYGIGFFSVFMLGDDIRVTSRRFNETAHSAKSLHFRRGADSRPVLSGAAAGSEHMVGTVVEVRLREHPYLSGGLVDTDDDAPTHDFAELCSWLCPTFPVTIAVSDNGAQFVNVVTADDWKSISAKELLSRLIKSANPRNEHLISEFIDVHAPYISEVRTKNGALVGRATALQSWLGMYHRDTLELTVTVGGCRCTGEQNVVGVLLGKSKRAARDKATFLGTREDLDRWAQKLADDLTKADLINEAIYLGGRIFESCGIECDELYIAKCAKGQLNYKNFVAFARKHKTIIVVDKDAEYDLARNRALTYLPSVLIMNTMIRDVFHDLFESEPCTGHRRWGDEDKNGPVSIMASYGFAAIAEAWGVSLKSLRGSAYQQLGMERQPPKNVAHDDYGSEVKTSEYIVLQRRLAEHEERFRTDARNSESDPIR
jgi:hypothetical protein